MKHQVLRKTWLAGALAGVMILGGCGSTQAEVSTLETEQAAENTEQLEGGDEVQADSAYVFTDDLGREVTVESADRVAAMIGSFADVWLLSGGDLVAAANDSWESLELDLSEDVVNIGSILEPDVEQLIAAEPDFVLASANTDADIQMEEQLTEAGITVAYFAVSNFDEYLHMLDVCTDITGRKDLYEENGTKVVEQITEVKERVDGSAPTVLFLRAASSSVKAKGSSDNVCGEMLADLGCINIADSDESLLDDLSMEAIIVADPDYIFVTVQGYDVDAAMQNVEDLLISNPAWSSLTAVKNDNYYVLDKRLYNLKPNARWGEAYENLADILYPEE